MRILRHTEDVTEVFQEIIALMDYIHGVDRLVLEVTDTKDRSIGHIRALLSITPVDAGSLFRHCKVPGCEHFTRMRERKNGQLKKDRSLVVAMVASAAAIATVATLGV